jgi:membrane-associated protease RseP (regulator of RpoE activity)
MTRFVTMFWTTGLSAILGLAGAGLAQNAEKQGQSPQGGVSTVPVQTTNPVATWRFTNDLLNITNDRNIAWFTYANASAGMELAAADDSLREHLKFPKDQGLVVLSLDPQSSPAQAGLLQNDVLLLVGDRPVAKPEELDDGLKQAGDEPVPLTVLRGGKRLKLRVQPVVKVTLGPVQAEAPAFWIGVSVAALEPALRSQLQVTPPDKGLTVIDVVKEGPAAQAGVKIHDILLTLAGKPLTKQEQLIELVQANGEKSAALEVIREGKAKTIDITPARRKTARVSDPRNKELNRYYRILQPGAVVQSGINLSTDVAFPVHHRSTELLSQPGEDQVSKRLDALDAELKQLRKAIEELSKSTKDK